MSSHHTRILGIPLPVPASKAHCGSSVESSQAGGDRGIRAGDEIAGYEVVELIGEGGMGRVFKVRHPKLQKSFALKLISEKLEQDVSAVERFRIETLALGKLDHINIVQAIDAGHWNDRPFLVTQLLRGTDLASHVAAEGPLSFEQVRQLAIQIARGLQAAHEVGLFHRDIKPSNLFLDSDGTIKVLDFGLVRSNSNESCTVAGCLMGSVDYLSPEQASDPRQADARSDIYSLGCTLIYLLSGQPPFPDSDFPSLAAKLMAHRTQQSTWLKQPDHSEPHPLKILIGQMVAKDPDQRPRSAQEILDMLGVNSMPISNSGPDILNSGRNSRNVTQPIVLAAMCFLLVGISSIYILVGRGDHPNSPVLSAVTASQDLNFESNRNLHREMDHGNDLPNANQIPESDSGLRTPPPEIATVTVPITPSKETLIADKTLSARGAVIPSKQNRTKQNSPLPHSQPLGTLDD